MNKRVFISYSHKDQACAKAIEKFLTRQNCEVWIDYKNIKVDEAWADDIKIAITKSDAFLVLLSKDSIQREEVIKEINLAIERKKEDPSLKLVFVTIGQFRENWFYQDKTTTNDKRKTKIKNRLKTYQYIQLNHNGALTLSSTKLILDALGSERIFTNKEITDRSSYIYEEGDPLEVKDNDSKNGHFYRLHTNDLSPSTLIPYVMDEQWLPSEIIEEGSTYHDTFYKEGFHSNVIQEYMENYQLKHLYASLLYSRQIVLNRAALLNNRLLQKFYFLTSKLKKSEKKAFVDLLNDGSIITLLYDDDLITPQVIEEKIDYDVSEAAIENWNKLVQETSMYCIRENWSKEADFHKTELTRFTETISLDDTGNKMMAENFGIKDENAFFFKLKEIEETVFEKTHHSDKPFVEPYSRSKFYKDFIVDTHKKNSVIDCIFDQSKPFHLELKKMMDIYYNSIFINLLECDPQLPMNTLPKDLFIYQHFLKHGIKEVDEDEIEYAFTDFLENTNVLQEIQKIGNRFHHSHWSLSKIVELRRNAHWLEYIELLEYIMDRSTTYQLDFSKIDELIAELAECMVDVLPKCENNSFVASFTFRICVGNYVMDVITSQEKKIFVLYPGSFYGDGQNHLSVYLIIGDSTNIDSEMLFPQIKIFDGMTNIISGEKYMKALIKTFKNPNLKYKEEKQHVL